MREFRGGWQRNGTRSRISTKSILAIKGTIPGGHFHTPGLTNPLGADIHLVLHDHGPVDPAIVAAEIHSFGVCNLVCTNVQFSVHEQ